MSLLTVIVPCYNEEENVPFFYEELMKNAPFFVEKGLELELLYVDDGSRDRTVLEIKKLREKDERVHLVSFSRNFGKEAAIYAGLENSRGDYVVMMDADLQDPPSLLPEMFSFLEQGYDSVATRRVSRKGEPPVRSFFARWFKPPPSTSATIPDGWTPSSPCRSTIALRKESSDGWAFGPNGLSMRTWSG